MLNNYSDVLTVKEVAQALGICENSVYRLIHQKVIGSIKVGRKILVPKICLVDYLKSARYTVSHLYRQTNLHCQERSLL